MSASLGAGHDGAAKEIARRLQVAGYQVDRYDFLEHLAFGIGRRARTAYRRQLDVVPQTWEWLLNFLQRHPAAAAIVVWLATQASRPLGKAIGRDADAVVSTYPLASQVLDQLRRRNKFSAPLITYLTDPSVHPLWIAEGTDLYLAAHIGIADQVRMQGGKCVAVVAPAVRPEFHKLRSDAEKTGARTELGLPAEDKLALVASGSWAVGEIELSAREIAATGSVTPVVVCGDNTALRERLADLDGGVVLGWVEDMPALLRACDVAVLNSGGLTFFEARASGLPVYTYRALAGHGRTNARLLASSGLAPWLHDCDELGAALAKVTPRKPPVNGLQSYHPGDDSVGTACPTVPIAGLIRQWTEAPAHAYRSRKVARRLAVWSTVVLSLLWMCTFGTSMAVAHGFRAVGAGPSGSVFFVVDLPADQKVTQQDIDELRDLNASVAVSVEAAIANQDAVRRMSDAGLQLVNSAGGQPYETGIFTRRGSIGAGARLITQLTSHRPNLMLSNGDVDAIDVGMAAFYHERIIIPQHVLTCGQPLKLPTSGGVVLVHSGNGANCALDGVLEQLADEAAADNLHPTPLKDLTT
ncbi:MAG TPA: glycosyltransferase [Pseudonocardiaceae bacterium]|nr:glycosyltransferase [Pseudonocardiaceae bacterium]